MTLGLFYVLLSTSTKIFAGKNFRESVQTREKRENLHPAKLTGYTVSKVNCLYAKHRFICIRELQVIQNRWYFKTLTVTVSSTCNT